LSNGYSNKPSKNKDALLWVIPVSLLMLIFKDGFFCFVVLWIIYFIWCSKNTSEYQKKPGHKERILMNEELEKEWKEFFKNNPDQKDLFNINHKKRNI